MESAIEVVGLSHCYGAFRALDNLTFSIAPGKIVGILGPNGAGKSTLLRILSTQLKPTGGQVRILGWDALKRRQRVRPHLFLNPQQNESYDPALSVRDNLKFVSLLQGGSENRSLDEILELFGLAEWATKAPSSLSSGMLRKYLLARLGLVSSKILLLDEPTAGVDLIARRSVGAFVRGVRDTLDATVVVATHDIQEAEEICDEVLILARGKLVTQTTVQEIRKTYRRRVAVTFERPIGELASMEGADPATVRLDDGIRLEFCLSSGRNSLSRLVQEIEARGCVRSLSIQDYSLEDYFTAVVTGSQDEGSASG